MAERREGNPEYLAARARVHAAGYKPNPWRIGREMGRAYHRTFWAWSDAARISRDYWSGRPEEPANPYDAPNSARQWADGFRREARAPRPKEA